MAEDFTFEKQAMAGEEMPKGMPLADQLAYQALSHLYARYRMGQIEAKQGREEKGEIKREYLRNKRREEMGRSLSEHQARLYRVLEAETCAYAKSRSLDAADRIYQALYGVAPWESIDKGEENGEE